MSIDEEDLARTVTITMHISEAAALKNAAAVACESGGLGIDETVGDRATLRAARELLTRALEAEAIVADALCPEAPGDDEKLELPDLCPRCDKDEIIGDCSGSLICMGCGILDGTDDTKGTD